jgi:hypothetical protein
MASNFGPQTGAVASSGGSRTDADIVPALPGGFTPEGLPVGVQIVGRDKTDFSVLQLAHAFENATGFGKKRPAIA